MRIHRNAETTAAARMTLVHRVLREDWTYAETAAAFAVSERTVAKWVRRFRAAWQALALRHLPTRPYTPRTNGKAERFIQTLLREWAYVGPYPASQIRPRQLRPFLRSDNRRRPQARLPSHAPWSRRASAA